MSVIHWVAILTSVAAVACSALTGLSLHYDWKHLRSAGINGEVEHVVRGMKRNATIRTVGSGVILVGMATEAQSALLVLALMALAASTTDWRDRRVAKLMAAIRFHASEHRKGHR